MGLRTQIAEWIGGQDNVITVIPRKAKKRGYSAADNTARYGDFRASRGSADYELRQGLATVRAKSRFLARNSPSIVRYKRLMQLNIVGPDGFVFQSRVRKLDKKMDAQLNVRVEDAFKRWSEAASTCGKMTLTDLMDQRVGCMTTDGESIWEIVYNPRYRDGIAINVIEADLLDETLNTIYGETGNEIRMGVEVNRYGEHVAYHFLTQHPGDATWYQFDNKSRYRRVPAERVLHTYHRERPGQTRGEPYVASVINSVKMLDGYREAEVVGRRLRSSLGGFFTRESDGPGGIDELAEDRFDDPDYEDDDEAQGPLEMDMTPGTLKELPRGVSFTPYDPDGTTTDYRSFEGQIKKDIAMGLNISAMSHGMETEGISYSAGRTIVMEDRDHYRVHQKFHIRHDLIPLFRKWILMHVLSETSVVPPTRIDAIIESAVFRPRGWGWVDPMKEVKANSEALMTKQTSLARVAAAQGLERDDLLDEIEEDEAAALERGLTLSYNITKADTKKSSDNGDNGKSDDDD